MLPSELSVLAELHDGRPLSLVLGLSRNARDQLDVRIADGAQVYDGRRVWALEPTAAGVAVRDAVTGASLALAAPPGARLLRLQDRTAWLQTEAGLHACDLRDGDCAATGSVPEPILDHVGPGPGFHLALENGALRVTLPQDQDAGVVLATGVARLLGVYWVRGATGEADAVLHRTFRGRARVHALARATALDGDLSDWPDAAPLVVEAPWQLQAGGEGWGGTRDASFSVAAAWTAERVCLAGRVRDDALGDGDALTVALGEARRTVPLVGAAPADAVVRREWLGAAWELCVPTAELEARATLPFAVSYADADPGEAPTVLASAPLADGTPLGELLLDAPQG